MNNSTTNSQASRPIKSLYSSGQSNAGQGTGTRAGENEPQSAYGAQIAQTALQSVGVCTRDFPSANTSNPEYAAAVSTLFTKATNQAIMLGMAPRHVLSTSLLYNSLLHDKRFKRVPMSESAPGDIIVASVGHQAAGYAGIVMDHGRIASMGTTGTVQNNDSVVELQRSHQEMAVFRYIGVQRHTKTPLANQGYNPDEARLSAGQPGGGQWTTSDASGGESPAVSSRAATDLARALVSKKAAVVEVYHKGGSFGELSAATKEDINRILQDAFSGSGVDAGIKFIETDKNWGDVGVGMYDTSSGLKIAAVYIEAVNHGPMGWAAPGKFVGQYNQKMIDALFAGNYDQAVATTVAHELFHHAIGNSTIHPYSKGYVDANIGLIGGDLSPEAAKSLRQAFGYK